MSIAYTLPEFNMANTYLFSSADTSIDFINESSSNHLE